MRTVSEQSINNPNSWRVTDEAGNLDLGYVNLVAGEYVAYGAKLHSGKGGMRKKLGPFPTLEEAAKAIEESHKQ